MFMPLRQRPVQTLVRSLSALALLASLLPATLNAAQVYRWTDENGQVHFSSNPPVDKLKQAENYDVKTLPPATPVPGAANKDAPAAGKPAEKDTEMKGSVSTEDADKYCKQGRDYKQTLASNFNRRYTRPDGSMRPLTDAERAEENTKADKIIKQYCQP